MDEIARMVREMMLSTFFDVRAISRVDGRGRR